MTMYYGNYILDDAGNPVPEPDIYKWGDWFEATAKQSYHGDPRRVAISQVREWKISTVFLAIDHSFNGGAPLLWETMVFGPEPWGDWQDRYTSKADAEAGHKRIYELILAGKDPPEDA